MQPDEERRAEAHAFGLILVAARQGGPSPAESPVIEGEDKGVGSDHENAGHRVVAQRQPPARQAVSALGPALPFARGDQGQSGAEGDERGIHAGPLGKGEAAPERRGQGQPPPIPFGREGRSIPSQKTIGGKQRKQARQRFGEEGTRMGPGNCSESPERPRP